MSTRATTHFQNSSRTVAIVYRHPDGYPKGLGQDLRDFFQEVKDNTKDTRFGDASYLAARWVVRDSQRYAHTLKFENNTWEYEINYPLDFLSVGLLMEDPGDIEYRYIVDCDHQDQNGLPLLYVEGVRYSGEGVARQVIES